MSQIYSSLDFDLLSLFLGCFSLVFHLKMNETKYIKIWLSLGKKVGICELSSTTSKRSTTNKINIYQSALDNKELAFL